MKTLQFSKELCIFSLFGMMLFLIAGCASWSTSSVERTQAAQEQKTVQPTQANKILITKKDIKDRSYSVVGDITVTVNKTTLFHADPTREMVNEKLREEGAKLGADAVIFVRYGKVGVSFWSYGSLEGKGRAVKFNK